MTQLDVNSHPFPHSVVDGWWDQNLLRDVLGEFPDPNAHGWRRYSNGNERKLEGPPALWGDRTRELFDLIEQQTPVLEAAYGITGLHMETIGGGYHCIAPGGYLAIHTDFNRSTKTRRHRRLNLLIYLNEAWDDEGGHLELWDAEERVVSVAPEFNRTVVFETSDRSWHGHSLPAQRWRRSVAAYFFTEEAPPGYRGDQSTVWHAP
ncbi:Rps23 Pro-64 3,4-dihydroxylase Tpa1-like proline 4-hydroxylase [Lentzea atacamensis]|uniref:Rps23 Pro-64 3,4-dihydroxylase Tpa1-like proline 4-hydroxylase n=1 Tax=Lentzea atacamensis TaxID=531938 RepID=A0A316HTW5_9PSEU|nr:2OG-Fe(II) oxygenase [Lentzea atacamensis]PWK81722.1 Rps23 Pro-64 3,4-dihydroxylase Tpa1-like proline 4-hydroxylase [Lentzea atacamensis]